MKLVLVLAGWTALVLLVAVTLGASLAVLFGAERTGAVAEEIGGCSAFVWLAGGKP
jgi:tRNA C32,U32 (ribose-2'-O)-methylase TrmJ